MKRILPVGRILFEFMPKVCVRFAGQWVTEADAVFIEVYYDFETFTHPSRCALPSDFVAKAKRSPAAPRFPREKIARSAGKQIGRL